MVASQTDNSNTNNTVATSFTSSTRPIITDQHSTTEYQSTIATMSDINGKAPINGASNSHRAIDEPVIKVQPPRREDLQPSYARVIKPDDADADTNGWYGSMVRLEVYPCHINMSNKTTDQHIG
jgi:erythrocyte band 7 integral membrane protein